jgi:hypothetical protein
MTKSCHNFHMDPTQNKELGWVQAAAVILGLLFIISGAVLVVTGLLADDAITRVTLWGGAFGAIPLGVAALQRGLGKDWPRHLPRFIEHYVRRFRSSVFACFLAATMLICASDSAASNTLISYGDLALIRDRPGPGLLYIPSSGGIGYCSRKDGRWETRWFGPAIVRNWWPPLENFAAFGSIYAGIEVIGRRGNALVFGYRDDKELQWHDLGGWC